jgi:hypothetical protein
LIFSGNFNQPIDGCIPFSVTHLTLGYYFNQPIKGIPSSIKKIIIYSAYKLEIEPNVRLHAKIE